MHLYRFGLLPLVLYFVYYFFAKMFLAFIDCDVTLGFVEKFGKPISSLKGKVVFITGASSGIGEYTALALAEHGVKLVLAARRLDELERVKRQCLDKAQEKLTPNDILVLQMDVLKFDQHQSYFDEALRHFGKIDVVLNNAGRSQRANWENIDLLVDREMFDLNVFGVLNFSRIAVRYFLAQKGGHIAVTSSVTGVVGVPYSASYTGTKFALHGYFNCLRAEKIPNNIAVSILCPGPTFTNFLSNCFTETTGQSYGKDTTPTDKRMTAERCGHLCAVALANKLEETWMGVLPLMPLLYIAVYSPVTYKTILKIVGPRTLMKLRDGKEEIELPAGNAN